jgi:hypothetical protein
MNPYGSYRSLLGNSTSAIMAAIEIYNKPRFDYRTECFVMLLLNSWELVLKAMLSKNKIRIFERKARNTPYRTIQFWDALQAAKPFFPASIPHLAVERNLDSLSVYRNNAVHYYNDEGIGTVIYGLAQTSIVNFRDLVDHVFGVDIAEGVSINLLPLSFSAPPDPIQFIGSRKAGSTKPVVAAFLKLISEGTAELEKQKVDTGRFLTVFRVKTESTKKISTADIIAGISATTDSSNILLLNKTIDPNKSHTFTRKEVVEAIGDKLRGERFTTYTFDALVNNAGLKEDLRYCWKSDKSNFWLYSPDLVQWLKAQTAENIKSSVAMYKLKQMIAKKKKK